MAKAEKTQAVKRVNKAIAYKQVFSTDAGKLVLSDLMSAHFMLSNTHHGEKTHETAFNEGQRSVVIRILKFVQVDVTALRKYIEEIEDDVRANSDDPIAW